MGQIKRGKGQPSSEQVCASGTLETKMIDMSNTIKHLNDEKIALIDENNNLKAMVASLSREIKDLRGERVQSSSNSTSARQIRPATHNIIHNNIDILTDVDVLSAGLTYCGFDRKRQQRVNLDRNIRRFKAFFGVSPTTIVPMMKDLKDNNTTMCYKDCLMGMNWLYLYDSQEVLSGRWGRCENDIGKIVIQYSKMIQGLKAKKIRFEFSQENLSKYTYLASYDTVNFLTQEFRLDPSGKVAVKLNVFILPFCTYVKNILPPTLSQVL